MKEIKKIVLASGNKGKLREFNALFSELNIDVSPQSDFATPEIEETGLTFIENAILKARNACKHSGLPVIADDSGIEVDALNGAPGIYSARFAGEQATDKDNIEKLLHDLKEVPDTKRTARFQCVLVFLKHESDPTPLICQGTWDGIILHQPSGSNGFFYDPIFYVPTHSCSSAQLDSQEKNRISHRGQALSKLLISIKRSDSRFL